MVSEITLSGFDSSTVASNAATVQANNARQSQGQTTPTQQGGRFHNSAGRLAHAAVTAQNHGTQNQQGARARFVAPNVPNAAPANNQSEADESSEEAYFNAEPEGSQPQPSNNIDSTNANNASTTTPRKGLLRRAATGILNAFGRNRQTANSAATTVQNNASNALGTQAASARQTHALRFAETPVGAAGIANLSHLLRPGSDFSVHFDNFVDDSIPDGLYQQAQESFGQLQSAISTLAESSNSKEWSNNLEQIENAVVLVFLTLTKSAETSLGADRAITPIQRMGETEQAFFAEIDNLKRQI